MKAFLSHSSVDKELVGQIARELGRQFCVYDSQVFSTGIEFKKSIEEGLDDSSVLVLFASKAAIDSIWVSFEIEEAWIRKVQGKIASALVYIIDSSIDYNDLPEWMRRSLIRRQIGAKIIARDIRAHLDQLLRSRQSPFFTGRSREIELIEQVVTPIDGSSPPRAFILAGLPGIGRRSLVKKVSPSILNLKKFVEIQIGEGDNITDISILVADRVEPYSTKNGLKRIIDEIRSLKEEEALQRLLDNLRKMVSVGELPIFIDNNGIINSNGYLTEPIRKMLRTMTVDDEAYVVILTSRRPQDDYEDLPPLVHIGSLRSDEMKRLLSVLASNNHLNITASDLVNLAEFVAGYPPAAYFAINQAKAYGLELVMQNKTRLVEFRTSVFLKHIAAISLSDNERDILRTLALYSPLPLSVLGHVLAIKASDLTTSVVRLIDLSLVTIDDDGYYQIAEPIASAALSAFGFPLDSIHDVLSTQLVKFLSSSKEEKPELSLYRVQFRAAILAGDRIAIEESLHLSNDLISLTETLYHSRRYKEAIEIGRVAVEERPSSERARGYLIRALIQEEYWQEAEKEIAQLREYAPHRNVLFLKGFLLRKRNRISEAIDAYLLSKENGRNDVALNRELAHCYLIIGELELAAKSVKDTLKLHSDNKYAVDLWVQIAMRQNNNEELETALGQLELIDPMAYYHRKSQREVANGQPGQAEMWAQKAYEYEQYPPLNMIVQYANCKIILGKTTEAKEIIDLLDKRFSRRANDIRVGLRCNLEIAQGHYAEALRLSQNILDKNSYYKKIRKNALTGELKNSAITDDLRERYSLELTTLETEIIETAFDDFLMMSLDDLPDLG